jgi:hypothetical protein
VGSHMRAGFVSEISMGDSYESRNSSCPVAPWIKEENGVSCEDRALAVFNIVRYIHT